ncbi:MAG: cytochrome P450 [Defluviicoccus sp.]|nr:cytochrome P450 [Defluviicoccus sp.]MDE0276601.1 cytochrome P450 [Defluviicoccus sp.]
MDDRALADGFEIARLTRDFLDDPFPTYHALRRHAPVKRMADGSVFLTRYADVDEVYHDPERYSSDKTVDFRPAMGDTPLYEHHTTSLVFNDAPYHTRVRKRLMPAFTPRALRALQPRVEAVVDEMLDSIAEKGSCDLIRDLASALPVELIGDMLGIPRPERAPLRAWSLAILSGLEPRPTADQVARGSDAVEEFKDYLRTLVARRLRDAGDDDAEVLSKLIGPDEAGEALSELELLHNCIFLLNAGHETTTNLIGNGVEALIRFPDQMRRLRDDPSLIGTAVEEFLRYESSNQIGNRRLRVDAALGGEMLAAGTYIHMSIGAANRDPAEFPDPDRLDIARTPNRHLAFGAGVHACAGMSLARMEGKVAVGKLVARFRNIELAGTPERGGRARFRGFNSLPLSVR